MAAGACHVSLVQLLQTPEAFEGRAIAVVIFYPGDGARALFANRDAADANGTLSTADGKKMRLGSLLQELR